MALCYKTTHRKERIVCCVRYLHQQYDFQKIQKILGYDLEKDLRIRENSR